MGKPATIDAGQEQHLQALEYANRVRLARARMKRRVAAGELSAAEVILSCPWQAHSMSISDLLMSQKRWEGHGAGGCLCRSASRRTSRSGPSPSGSALHLPLCSPRRMPRQEPRSSCHPLKRSVSPLLPLGPRLRLAKAR